jgi:hypothetical protein
MGNTPSKNDLFPAIGDARKASLTRAGSTPSDGSNQAGYSGKEKDVQNTGFDEGPRVHHSGESSTLLTYFSAHSVRTQLLVEQKMP